MSKRCQPEVRGPTPTLNGINGTNGDGTTTEPTATPNWRVCVPFLVGGIRGREEFVWRIQPLYVRIGPRWSQYGEFFRDIEEYAHASVFKGETLGNSILLAKKARKRMSRCQESRPSLETSVGQAERAHGGNDEPCPVLFDIVTRSRAFAICPLRAKVYVCVAPTSVQTFRHGIFNFQSIPLLLSKLRKALSNSSFLGNLSLRFSDHFYLSTAASRYTPRNLETAAASSKTFASNMVPVWMNAVYPVQESLSPLSSPVYADNSNKRRRGPPSQLQIPTVHNRRDGSTDITTWALNDTRKLSIPWAARQDTYPVDLPAFFSILSPRVPVFFSLGLTVWSGLGGPFCSGEPKTVRYHRNCSEPIFHPPARTPSQLPALPGRALFLLATVTASVKTTRLGLTSELRLPKPQDMQCLPEAISLQLGVQHLQSRVLGAFLCTIMHYARDTVARECVHNAYSKHREFILIGRLAWASVVPLLNLSEPPLLYGDEKGQNAMQDHASLACAKPHAMPCNCLNSHTIPHHSRDGHHAKARISSPMERPWLWLQQPACPHRSPRAKKRAPLGVARTLLTSEAGFAWLPALSLVLVVPVTVAAESAARAKGKKAITEMADSQKPQDGFPACLSVSGFAVDDYPSIRRWVLLRLSPDYSPNPRGPHLASGSPASAKCRLHTLSVSPLTRRGFRWAARHRKRLELRLPSLVCIQTLGVSSGPPAIKCITPRGSKSAFSLHYIRLKVINPSSSHTPHLFGERLGTFFGVVSCLAQFEVQLYQSGAQSSKKIETVFGKHNRLPVENANDWWFGFWAAWHIFLSSKRPRGAKVPCRSTLTLLRSHRVGLWVVFWHLLGLLDESGIVNPQNCRVGVSYTLSLVTRPLCSSNASSMSNSVARFSKHQRIYSPRPSPPRTRILHREQFHQPYPSVIPDSLPAPPPLLFPSASSCASRQAFLILQRHAQKHRIGTSSTTSASTGNDRSKAHQQPMIRIDGTRPESVSLHAQHSLVLTFLSLIEITCPLRVIVRRYRKAKSPTKERHVKSRHPGLVSSLDTSVLRPLDGNAGVACAKSLANSTTFPATWHRAVVSLIGSHPLPIDKTASRAEGEQVLRPSAVFQPHDSASVIETKLDRNANGVFTSYFARTLLADTLPALTLCRSSISMTFNANFANFPHLFDGIGFSRSNISESLIAFHPPETFQFPGFSSASVYFTYLNLSYSVFTQHLAVPLSSIRLVCDRDERCTSSCYLHPIPTVKRLTVPGFPPDRPSPIFSHDVFAPIPYGASSIHLEGSSSIPLGRDSCSATGRRATLSFFSVVTKHIFRSQIVCYSEPARRKPPTEQAEVPFCRVLSSLTPVLAPSAKFLGSGSSQKPSQRCLGFFDIADPVSIALLLWGSLSQFNQYAFSARSAQDPSGRERGTIVELDTMTGNACEQIPGHWGFPFRIKVMPQRFSAFSSQAGFWQQHPVGVLVVPLVGSTTIRLWPLFLFIVLSEGKPRHFPRYGEVFPTAHSPTRIHEPVFMNTIAMGVSDSDSGYASELLAHDFTPSSNLLYIPGSRPARLPKTPMTGADGEPAHRKTQAGLVPVSEKQ
ncbi:uncharacterized protein CLUP02_09891 [Colletotrichum lupini]|uniref:Uncharacterized protein n=1 Tax=Colletotrichum lupini TaxID=145971 RepID=A0A9Q8SVP9_9PEZI|nr:uncharacterized protein CLUP02_09891 [Colletotrichum lupini]UQC84394.1 hypothetical protein CLUP02_09891 [Colletotrichum lupini]